MFATKIINILSVDLLRLEQHIYSFENTKLQFINIMYG